MLGELVQLLLQARLPVHRESRALRDWINANHPRLPIYLTNTPVRRLEQLATLRGEAQHGSVTEEQARRVYEEALAFLSAIVAR